MTQSGYLNTNMDYDHLCLLAIKASLLAGNAIIKHYNTDFSIDYKADNSPLTVADNDSHKVISQFLSNTNLPLLSEEGKEIPYSERSSWTTFWLIDPLDGTKEFIHHNGEFTVNIALIQEQRPIIGVIYIPVTKMLYFAINTHGSYMLDLTHSNLSFENVTSLSSLISIAKKLPIDLERPVTIIGSRSHQNQENIELINLISKRYGKVEVINVGSSLKFCKIAEGSADYYPRLGPTMEWDTAAGDAIATIAGAKVYNYTTRQELLYNKENLLNPNFIVVAKEKSL